MEQQPTTLLLDGLSQKDRKCQELFYQQYYSYGMSICLRYTGTRDEAVEVLHDGLLKVFDKIGQYDRKRPFNSWLRRILINTAINHYRAHLHQLPTDGLEGGKQVVALEQDAFGEMSYQEMINLIQCLSPIYRTVFNLHVIEGYSHEEIAKMLDITVGTSKSNLSRARENLRNMLTKNHEKGLAKHER